MTTLTPPATPSDLRMLAIDTWYATYEDVALRKECPSTYHETLLRQADEMDRQKLVEWKEWRDLRVLADEAFLVAVAGGDYRGGSTCSPPRQDLYSDNVDALG
ncbi:hypothetical protein IAE37_001827 [Pseudomonas sp. S31]|uniref:hypothetical protein n=1 Tax=Pseudomonas sp. S31 TaxID=1564473 RepID=UPI002E29C40E|nr:hypothetical protein [Pseudomonas sp. S31]MBK4999551.1 hypothetical protein [Pseudomonas sp. S31]